MAELERVLITGGSGFIGQHLQRYLAEQPVAIRTFERASGGDLTDLASVTQACREIDTVIHLAGYAHADIDDAVQHQQINVQGTAHLIQAAQTAGVSRLVLISSVKAGQPHDPLAEPNSAYSQAKRQAEALLLQAAPAFKQATIIRPALVYGAGVKGNLARLMKAMQQGWLPPLPAHPAQTSLVYVEDLVRLIWQARQAHLAQGKILLAAPQQASLHEIYQYIRQAQGKAEARWSVPLSWLKAASKGGDLIQHVSGRRMPINSAWLNRLFTDQRYQANEGVLDGFKQLQVPITPLAQGMAAMTAALMRPSCDSCFTG